MTTFEPGTPVWHPEHGFGLVWSGHTSPQTYIGYIDANQDRKDTIDFTGWERARIAGEVEVVVKVDDLDLSGWVSKNEDAVLLASSPIYGQGWRVAIRAANAWAELQANVNKTPKTNISGEKKSKSAEHSDAEQPKRVKDCYGGVWTLKANGNYSIVSDEGKLSLDKLEKAWGPITVLDNETEPAQDEQPTAEVSLPCPECGEQITRTATLVTFSDGGGTLGWTDEPPQSDHYCKPAQPDEPHEFGAKVTFTDDFGKSERFCRQWDGFWATSDGVLFGWRELIHLGTVTLGWSDEQ